MPIDRAARDQLATVLSAYMRGEADNFRLDEEVMGAWSKDQSLRHIRIGLWFVYDDIKRHKISANSDLWELLRRTNAFLRSDLELQPKEIESAAYWCRKFTAVLSLLAIALSIYLSIAHTPFWLLLPGVTIGIPLVAYSYFSSSKRLKAPEPSLYPFANDADYQSYIGLISEENLPSFDATLHGRPVRSKSDVAILSIFSLPLAALIVMPLFALIPLLERRRRIG